MDYSPPGSSVLGVFSGKITGVVCHALLWELVPNPGIKAASSASPALAGGFFTTEPLGEPTRHRKHPHSEEGHLEAQSASLTCLHYRER